MAFVTWIPNRRIQVGLIMTFAGSVLLQLVPQVLKGGTETQYPTPLPVTVPSGYTNQAQYQNGIANRERLTSHSNLQQGQRSQVARSGHKKSVDFSEMAEQKQYRMLVNSTAQRMSQRNRQFFSSPDRLNSTLLKEQKTVCTETKTLPQPVIAKIKSYLYFIGHAHSGHSIVGSILDSHPHIVVSHEYDVFNKLSGNRSCDSKECLFNALWKNSCMSITSGWRNAKKVNKKGYTLTIDNLYQDAYQSYIDVIGDKKGGGTGMMYAHNHDRFESTLDKLKSIVSLPIKVIHVIRNPYDNIATTALYNYKNRKHVKVTTLKTSDLELSIDPGIVMKIIDWHFKLCQAIEEMKVKDGLDVLEVHGKDLITDPKMVLIKLCNFLQVDCPDNFLAICADKIFPKESKTRYQVKWSNTHLSAIKMNIQKYENLHRYLDFDS